MWRLRKSNMLTARKACFDRAPVHLTESLPKFQPRKRPMATTSHTVAGNDQSAASICGT